MTKPPGGPQAEDEPHTDACPSTAIPIRELPDLRCLRIAHGGMPSAVGSVDNSEEEDFGIKRSTAEEAWEFYRETVEESEESDDLKEFLDER